MAKRKNQAFHDSIILQVIDQLEKEEYTDIKADILGFILPDIIYEHNFNVGQIPDITAVKDEKMYLYEIETADSIDDVHTNKQWNLFSKHASDQDKIFTVVVPMGYAIITKSHLELLNLRATIWEVGDI